MPQPLNFVAPKASVFLSENALVDKPDLAILVTRIFAHWAFIEQDLRMLLVHVLGANATPAIAMHAALQSQTVQMQALKAAARAAMPADHFEMVEAVLTVTDTVQKHRNKLAHRIWGISSQLPDALLLANPDVLKRQKIKAYQEIERLHAKNDGKSYGVAYEYDRSQILVYSREDLQNAVSEMADARRLLGYISALVAAGVLKKTRDEVPRRLEASRLFRQARDSLRERRNKNPQSPPQ